MPTDDSLQLHDIHLPDNADVWPLAFGWWVLLFLLLVAFAVLIQYYRQRLKRQRKKTVILKQLKKLENQLKNNPSNESLAKVNTLLRQLAITHYPRSEIASLTGSNWLHFLDQSGKTHDFSKGAGRILIEAPYRAGKSQNLNLEELIPLVRKWISTVLKKTKTNYKSEIL
ncbi:MAG: DUF4381 domain-containing protein [Cocleimonas sp.]